MVVIQKLHVACKIITPFGRLCKFPKKNEGVVLHGRGPLCAIPMTFTRSTKIDELLDFGSLCKFFKENSKLQQLSLCLFVETALWCGVFPRLTNLRNSLVFGTSCKFPKKNNTSQTSSRQ